MSAGINVVIVVLGKHESLDLRTSLRAKLDWSDVLFIYCKKLLFSKLFSKKSRKESRKRTDQA